ncbi:uncharacterized protein EAE98_006417 [Botrytis deweyae]|uniref:Uncharacterized protein n=1 Tax=Botrytis deweyae TaxID=2478750 RepID=A0ABQ7IKV5_9HELO|nr:uncharacterized protein EAE98_006417 [Botrytis deweyae]KAF7927033.1 hypothetical protein EAE98_006417 [Botrytis deweyae]
MEDPENPEVHWSSAAPSRWRNTPGPSSRVGKRSGPRNRASFRGFDQFGLVVAANSPKDHLKIASPCWGLVRRT